MSNLLSPGVQTSLIDQSYYAPGQASAVPLFYIATRDQKTQADGLTPAIGTYEYGVLRTVTSLTESMNLYGIPSFLKDANGNPLHGSSQNEYGLEALNEYLQVGNLAYVIRANVNLNDNLASLLALWNNESRQAANLLNTLIQTYIQQYNARNNLLPNNVNYKQTVTASEFLTILSSATQTLFGLYSFSSQVFQNAFLNDHSVPQAGYQDVLFNTVGGYLQLTDATGYVATDTYGAEVQIVSGTGTSIVNLTVSGNNAQTFGQLITYINSALGSTGTAELLNGMLRISSSLEGVTSSVIILVDGPSGSLPMFASLNLYSGLDTPTSGTGAGALNTYNSTYTVITGQYFGLTYMVDNWTSGSIIPTQFTAAEAQGLFSNATNLFETTAEFVQYTSLGANDAAARAVIVQQLNAIINNTALTGVLHESNQFNILAAPGYPECANSLTALAQTLMEEVVVVGSTPMNVPPTGPNGVVTWGTSPNRVNNYLTAYYYPHGLTTNLDGSVILADSASAAVRTYAYNDSVAELWYAPAGANRGTCPQLSNIGYVSGTLGTRTTFVQEQMDQGSRDALYVDPVQINPLTYIQGRGILVFGQKNSSPVSSSLNRVNVARLTAFIRRSLRSLLFAYLFEPNDSITRANVLYAVNGFMSPLVTRRGLYDYVAVCDSSNNPPSTIQRHQLYVDIYIQPTIDIEYIYVPITLEDTGAALPSSSSNGSQVFGG
jgi:hypothetical protein